MSIRRNFVCVLMAAILPVSMLAQDSAEAMLHTSGRVSLNKMPAPVSSAVYPGTLIETQNDKQDVATVDGKGFAVTIGPATIVQLEGNELVLDHGSLQVNTATQLKVRIGCLTVIPVVAEWTEYDVTDVDGRVTVAARKHDVTIESHTARPVQAKTTEQSRDAIVHEGEQTTRPERCGAISKTAVDARGAILNSPMVKWPSIAVIGGAACWALCRGDDPISPSHP